MDYNDAKFFFYVAKNLSFTKAAAELYVAQSSVSERIKRFEDSLGFPLFIRNNNKIQLTNKGITLYQIVGRFVTDMETFESHMKSDRTTLKIGISKHVGSALLTNIYSQIASQFNEIHLTYALFEDNFSNLENEKIDCMFVSNGRLSPNTTHFEIGHVQFVIITSTCFTTSLPYECLYIHLSTLPIVEIKEYLKEFEEEVTLVDITDNIPFFLTQMSSKNSIAIVPITFANKLLSSGNAVLHKKISPRPLFCTIRTNLSQEKKNALLKIHNVIF